MTIKMAIDRKNRRADIHIKNANRVTKNQIRLGFMMLGNRLVDDCRRYILEPPKTGIKWPSLKNRSSKKGESPAEQSGLLRRSINYQQRGGDQMDFGSRIDYAPFLEGDLERPFISRAVDENERNGEKIMEDSIKQGLNK